MFCKDGLQADGGSILSILSLDAPQGSQLTVKVQGPDGRELLKALQELFADGFGEEQ
jgi:phosphocarrier protein